MRKTDFEKNTFEVFDLVLEYLQYSDTNLLFQEHTTIF